MHTHIRAVPAGGLGPMFWFRLVCFGPSFSIRSNLFVLHLVVVYFCVFSHGYCEFGCLYCCSTSPEKTCLRSELLYVEWDVNPFTTDPIKALHFTIMV